MEAAPEYMQFYHLTIASTATQSKCIDANTCQHQSTSQCETVKPTSKIFLRMYKYDKSKYIKEKQKECRYH